MCDHPRRKKNCTGCYPPESLGMNEHRSPGYWARVLGVARSTIYRHYGDVMRRHGTRRLIARKHIDRRNPGLIGGR